MADSFKIDVKISKLTYSAVKFDHLFLMTSD